MYRLCVKPNYNIINFQQKYAKIKLKHLDLCVAKPAQFMALFVMTERKHCDRFVLIAYRNTARGVIYSIVDCGEQKIARCHITESLHGDNKNSRDSENHSEKVSSQTHAQTAEKQNSSLTVSNPIVFMSSSQ